MSRASLVQSLGIRARVFILALLPVAIAVALLGYNLASSRLEDAERGLAERGSLIARNLALASEFALFSQNVPLVNDTLQRMAGEADIRWAAVWDRRRRVLISRGRANEEWRINAVISALEEKQPLPRGYYQAPIRVELLTVADFSEEYGVLEDGDTRTQPDHLLGNALVEVAPDRLVSRRAEILRNSLLIVLAGGMGSFLLAMLIGNSITDPVTRLINAVRELRSGNLAARVAVLAGGELGQLEEGINQMAETLQQSQRTLRLRIDESTQALRDTVDELEVRNRELEQAREVALRAGQERTQFLARMSHEIRTPLNAIVGFTRLLKTGSSDPANEAHIGTIQRAADQLLHVIDDILQFIRLDAGADQLEHMQFNIADVLEDAVAMLVPAAGEKGLELILLVHGDLPETAWGDQSRLSQVLVNLLNNAIKFTAEGQVMVEAEHKLDTNGDRWIVISVKDTGIGLAPEEQSRVFTAFTQSDSSITRRFGGTGLGLSIARRLIELMDGEIGVESSKGQGSRFWVRLPCVDCSAPAAVEGAGPLAGKKMLVYDTNPFVRRSLRSVMTAWGIQVFNTGDWERALGLLRQHQGDGFSALIVGLAPTEQQVEQVERYLLGLRRYHSGMVLLLTGSDKWTPPSSVSAMQPLDSGTKPIRRGTLRRLLLEHLAQPRRHTEAAVAITRRQDLPGLQVLVAEDNALNRSLLRHLLEEQGASVDEAITGKAAVSAAEHGGYDVILMDLHMPELDGAEAASRIRTTLGDRSPKILALTADVFGRSEIAGAEDQFDDWLLKPIDPVLLVRRLAELRGHDARQERRPADVQTGAPRIPVDLQRRYAHEIRRLLSEMRSASQSDDQASLQGALHNLKGLVGLLGYPGLQQLVEHLDTDRLEVDAEALDGQIAVLEHKVRQVLEDALPDVGY